MLLNWSTLVLLIEVGCCIFAVTVSITGWGYSMWLTFVGSFLLMIAAIILHMDEKKNRRPPEFASGPPLPPSVFVSEQAYQPPGWYPVYPQAPPTHQFQLQQQQAPYTQHPAAPPTIYQPPAGEHKFTDFQ